MTVDTMAILTLCEFIGIALIIYGFLRRDKLVRFERGLIRVAAVYVAVYKSWRKEKRNERVKAVSVLRRKRCINTESV